MTLLPHHLEDRKELDCRRALDEYLFAITLVYNLEHRFMFGVSPWKDGTISEYLRQVNMACASNSFKILQVSKEDPLKIKGRPGPDPPSLWEMRTVDESEQFWARMYPHMFDESVPKPQGPREFIISPEFSAGVAKSDARTDSKRGATGTAAGGSSISSAGPGLDASRLCCA